MPPSRPERIVRDRSLAMALLWSAIVVVAAPAAASFVTFESGQVRPLALSPDRSLLFAINTPDNRLEIFDVGAGGLTRTGSVSVGLEPVAVAARTNGEVWVVNHLSDSVSVVDVSTSPPRVVRTLLVGDEPRDIVFAGPGGGRGFITTARRGQNMPASVPALLTTPSTPRALVWVFDAANLGDLLTGTPLTIIALFGDTPRALAATPDGSSVYAAVFHSGNQTTPVAEGAVCNDPVNDGLVQGPCTVFGVTMPGGLPNPETNVEGIRRPETGLVVKFNPSSGHWEDRLARNWDNAVRFNLPDEDVFAIDANADPPAPIGAPGGIFTGVGTILFNMAVDPAQPNRVYVTNTESFNEIRFEGPGILGGSSVRGHLHEARITVLDGATVRPRHLNKHINYSVIPSPAGVKDKSLATPQAMAVTGDGATLYVAAFGSSAVGVFDTGELVADTFVPSAASHIAVSGGGPSGLALDEPRQRLYVLTRFDNAISVIDTAAAAEVSHLPLYDPEPSEVVDGRAFLYDAVSTSSNGEASCASCHVFGDFDSLAWDLGNPDGQAIQPNPNPFRIADPFGVSFPGHHPMKGPMTTQSLRGMANHGPMHWRGDRSGGNDPGGDPLDETQAFGKFIVTFESLLGRDGPIADTDMAAFAAFILQVTYPPNPIRALDNSLTAEEQVGHDVFFSSQPSDILFNCDGCHDLDPAAGHFGGDGFSSFEFESQNFKIPHLRNMYQKVGMFGMPLLGGFNPGNNAHQGDQVRGTGYVHDGSVDTLFRFMHTSGFNRDNNPFFNLPNPGGFAIGPEGDAIRRGVEAFVLAFDSNLAPVVGQQVTLSATAGRGIIGRKLVITDNVSDDPARRSIMAQSNDPAILAPDAGSSDDPRCGTDPAGTVKARITVVSGTTGQSHTSPLVCDNWTALGPASAPRGYRYRDPGLTHGTVKSLVWKAGKQLKVVFAGGTAAPIAFDLRLGVDQGAVDVELESGQTRLCLRCDDADGRDGSDGRRFRGMGATCFAPPQCSTAQVDGRIDLLEQRAQAAECELVVKGTLAGEARGWLYQPALGTFQSDRAADSARTDAQLRLIATVPGQALTYTCVPPGSGMRIGVDRDDDGAFDRDELDAGSDPTDPGSTP